MRTLAVLAIATALAMASAACEEGKNPKILKSDHVNGSNEDAQSGISKSDSYKKRDVLTWQDSGYDEPWIERPDDSSEDPSEWKIGFKKAACVKSSEGECYLLDATLDEASGIDASIENPGAFYVHNDEGDAVVYAIDVKGQILATIGLQGAKNHDFEDLAVHNMNQKSYVFVGDIGGNRGTRDLTIYRFAEPQLHPLHLGQSFVADETIAIQLRVPEGSDMMDFEAFMIDPRTSDLYLFQKGERRVYLASGVDIRSGKTKVDLELIVKDGSWGSSPSAAAFSPLGHEFVIRDEHRAWFYRLKKGESVADALERSPESFSMPDEFNGEAICFDHTGRDLITVSENASRSKSDRQPVSIIKREE